MPSLCLSSNIDRTHRWQKTPGEGDSNATAGRTSLYVSAAAMACTNTMELETPGTEMGHAKTVRLVIRVRLPRGSSEGVAVRILHRDLCSD